jgi:hypothetical protein
MHSRLVDFADSPKNLHNLYLMARNRMVRTRIVRVLPVVLLTLLVGGWDTCSAFVGFTSCPGPVPQARIASLSPRSIPSDANSVPLTVAGSGFTSQSQILWNGSTLSTTLTDSRHLQATITQQTFESFGGSSGSAVQIAVKSQGGGSGTGCPASENSEAVPLAID